MDGESWYWSRDTCSSLGGDLVSIETQEEWNLINDEIQRRNTTNYENKWRIGLKKRARNWTWVSGRPLTISKWGQGEPSGEHDAAFMYKRFRNGEQGVFGSDNGTSGKKQHAYICEISESELICCCCCCCFSFFFNVIKEMLWESCRWFCYYHFHEQQQLRNWWWIPIAKNYQSNCFVGW